MELDHIAISAAALAEGVEWVEDLLGVLLAQGGRHDTMGTHNRLLSLGPDLYLEVISIDPGGADPGRPRWFDLDRFAGPPRLTNWVLRCDDLDRALEAALPGTGAPMDLARGDLRWRMAVPADGRLPLDGHAPALIQWLGGGHPAGRLPDAGCALSMLHIRHPEADRLAAACGPLARVDIAVGPPEMSARILSPRGTVTLAC